MDYHHYDHEPIFIPCGKCGGLNRTPTTDEECDFCGSGRFVIEKIIKDIETRRDSKRPPPKPEKPCKVCGRNH